MSGTPTKPTHVMREVAYEELAGLKDRMSRYLPHSGSVSFYFLFLVLWNKTKELLNFARMWELTGCLIIIVLIIVL